MSIKLKKQLKFFYFKKRLISLLIALNGIVFKSTVGYAAAQIEVKRLQSTEFLGLHSAVSDKDILMLFQPDCSSCKAQIQELGCINPNSIKLLGTHESEERIETEYKRLKTNIPGFYIQPKTLKSISPNLVVMTPMFFLVKKPDDKPLENTKANPLKYKDRTVQLLKIGYGFQKCQTLKKKLITKLEE